MRARTVGLTIFERVGFIPRGANVSGYLSTERAAPFGGLGGFVFRI
jgi:hypothetical protein